MSEISHAPALETGLTRLGCRHLLNVLVNEISFSPARSLPVSCHWELIAVSHRPDLDELRGILGNDLSMKAYRGGRFPSRLTRYLPSWLGITCRWPGSTEPSSPGLPRRFKSWSNTRIKDRKKYLSTGGWGSVGSSTTARDRVFGRCKRNFWPLYKQPLFILFGRYKRLPRLWRHHRARRGKVFLISSARGPRHARNHLVRNRDRDPVALA
jgi:hypothetical protein